MRILFLAWKDIVHPQAGGAEVVLHELSKRLVDNGHSVTILTAKYKGASSFDTIDGAQIIRIGNNRYTHPFQAILHYRKYLRGSFDVVVETVNTAPYFYFLAGDTAKPFLFYHQLAREIWFDETPPPLSFIGYWILEPLATFILGKSRAKTITVSESTRSDLVKFGFRPDDISIISEGITMQPVKTLDKITKFKDPTLLGLGSFRAMKRTLDIVKAFEIAKGSIPDLKLKLAGSSSGSYGQRVLDCIEQSPFKADIEYLGRVSEKKKIELMQRSHLIGVTSLKEGWGLIVTEAASQGTPAVVYDVDGLRDSVRDGDTGIVTQCTPADLAAGVVQALDDQKLYTKMRSRAWQWSKKITFEQCYADFIKIVGKG